MATDVSNVLYSLGPSQGRAQVSPANTPHLFRMPSAHFRSEELSLSNGATMAHLFAVVNRLCLCYQNARLNNSNSVNE